MSIDRVSMMLLQKRVLHVDDVGDAFDISTKPNVSARWCVGGVGVHIRLLGSF